MTQPFPAIFKSDTTEPMGSGSSYSPVPNIRTHTHITHHAHTYAREEELKSEYSVQASFLFSLALLLMLHASGIVCAHGISFYPTPAPPNTSHAHA